MHHAACLCGSVSWEVDGALEVMSPWYTIGDSLPWYAECAPER
jgi:hypothetical protein